MTQITFKGNTINTVGSLPQVGTPAPLFTLTKTDLNDQQLKDFSGKKLILNIFPSIDTPVCARSVLAFNRSATEINNTVVLCISADLPFAQARFCGAEGLVHVMPLSDFRHKEFGEKYGVTITDGPLAGLLSRAVIAIDSKGTVIYNEQVPELGQEPNYEAVLAAVRA